jgi:hypothetical protein
MKLKILTIILMGLTLTTKVLPIEPQEQPTIEIGITNTLENQLIANAFSLRFLAEYEPNTPETRAAILRLQQERQALLTQLRLPR